MNAQDLLRQARARRVDDWLDGMVRDGTITEPERLTLRVLALAEREDVRELPDETIGAILALVNHLDREGVEDSASLRRALGRLGA